MTSTDGMTADYSLFPHQFPGLAATRGDLLAVAGALTRTAALGRHAIKEHCRLHLFSGQVIFFLQLFDADALSNQLCDETGRQAGPPYDRLSSENVRSNFDKVVFRTFERLQRCKEILF